MEHIVGAVSVEVAHPNVTEVRRAAVVLALVLAVHVEDMPVGLLQDQAGRGEMVFAPNIGGVVQLRGFARVETNLQSLRLVGEISHTFDDGDCTEWVSVFGEGFKISEDSFAMHVFETITLVGKEREAMGVGAPGVDEYEYLADFTYVPAPDQGDDGATNN